MRGHYDDFKKILQSEKLPFFAGLTEVVSKKKVFSQEMHIQTSLPIEKNYVSDLRQSFEQQFQVISDNKCN